MSKMYTITYKEFTIKTAADNISEAWYRMWLHAKDNGDNGVSLFDVKKNAKVIRVEDRTR